MGRACEHHRQNVSPVGPVCLDCHAVLTVVEQPPEGEPVRLVPLTREQRKMIITALVDVRQLSWIHRWDKDGQKVPALVKLLKDKEG